ncbi:hypothetical protein FM037_02265 [Shewanella psychropiezotolerans]|uniref:DUF1795 domain-containing protein n=1 Tax=Shewanella psychropiezotolerans TaxID=2593655 RepID=A0ABX5WV87_9GAMM|nr:MULTISPECIES: hypothetical protein [Shewanella]MPY25027.1 hypothetical protein [Shewanella sp. YLB-07]QDO82277.1 hypothetical protein FM037_02265 [Shewanella psychropiezotolerans]
MYNLFKITVIAVIITFVYQQWFAALPLTGYHLSSVPVKVKMLSGSQVSRSTDTTSDIESIIAPKSKEKPIVMVAMSVSSTMENFEESDIEFIPDEYQKFDQLGSIYGNIAGKSFSVKQDRGFIDQNGKRGYQMTMKMTAQEKEFTLVQQVFIVGEHLLVFMASYSDTQEENTAMAFLDSIEFL